MRTQDVASSSEEDREANAGAEEWTIKNRVISKKLVYMAEKILENPQYFSQNAAKTLSHSINHSKVYVTKRPCNDLIYYFTLILRDFWDFNVIKSFLLQFPPTKPSHVPLPCFPSNSLTATHMYVCVMHNIFLNT